MTQTNNLVDVNKLTCLIDLHLHLDGSLSINSVKELAKMQNITIPNNDAELKNLLGVKPDCRDLNEYLQKFDFPCSLLQTEQAIITAVYNLMEELKQQGLMYAEIRFAPQKHTLKGLSQEQVVASAIKGLEKSNLDGGLILCCMRDKNNNAENIETIKVAKKFLGNGVVAVDLAGAEALFPTKNFENLFELASSLNIPFTIHAGEADGAESVKSALNFGAKRIGHGVRAIEDEQLLSTIVKNGIILECCPTSNLNTQVFSDISKFPVEKFLSTGVKFTINTDNMSVSATNLRNEWNLIINTFNLTNQQVKSILLNSVEALFALENKKMELKQIINSQL